MKNSSNEVYLGSELINAMKALCSKPLTQARRYKSMIYSGGGSWCGTDVICFEALIDSYGVSISARTFFFIEKRIFMHNVAGGKWHNHELWANMMFYKLGCEESDMNPQETLALSEVLKILFLLLNVMFLWAEPSWRQKDSMLTTLVTLAGAFC